MELWHLRTFRTVAKTLHFTRASEELNLSQPAVSHQIKSLEEELGEKLFVRGRNGISLTPAGKVMLDHAEKILDITDALRDQIEKTRASSLSALSLGMISRGLGSNYAGIYQDFRNANPEIQLRYRVEPDAASLLAGIKTGRIDIGVIEYRPDNDDFESVPYGWARLQFLVGPTHSLAHAQSPGPEVLRNEKWALFEPGDPLRIVTDQLLSTVGTKPKSVFSTNDGSAIRDLIATGEFVGFLPSGGIVKELETGSIVNVPIPDLEKDVEINIIWQTGKKTNAVEALVSFLRERELPGLWLSKSGRSAKP